MTVDEPVAEQEQPTFGDQMQTTMDSVSDRVEDFFDDVAAAIKPRLRGWLHAGTFPFVLIAGTALVCLAPTAQSRVASAIYAVTSALLFGISAVYHRGNWNPRAYTLLKRFDHSNIYLIIAGTYTPFGLLALTGTDQKVLLTVAWAGAVGGVLFRTLWLDAPRWLYVPLYAALGCVSLLFLPQLLAGAGGTVVALLAAGGVLFGVGAVIYGIKRPNSWPNTFGFHEYFHSFVIVAWALHYVAVSMLVYQSG